MYELVTSRVKATLRVISPYRFVCRSVRDSFAFRSTTNWSGLVNAVQYIVYSSLLLDLLSTGRSSFNLAAWWLEILFDNDDVWFMHEDVWWWNDYDDNDDNNDKDDCNADKGYNWRILLQKWAFCFLLEQIRDSWAIFAPNPCDYICTKIWEFYNGTVQNVTASIFSSTTATSIF